MFLKLKLNLFKNKLLLTNNWFNRYIIGNNALINDKIIHRLNLKTCKNLYNSKKALNEWYLRFRPKEGIELNVEYVDTKPNDIGSRTLVALHGSPGNYLDFAKLVTHFGDNYRVIVPNFPDFSVTDETNNFWHSAEEKAEYIKDLLKVLNVSQIDCLICHSSAIFPTSYLWINDSELKIKSLCLLSNPGPKWYALKGRIAASLFLNISRFRFIRQYLRQIWSKRISEMLGIRNQISSYDSIALLLSTFYFSDSKTVEKRLEMLTELQIPTLSVFSSKDRLWSSEISYDLFRILGANETNFDVFEEHENVRIQSADNNNWLKVVDIRSGGHYCFVTHSQLVHKYIEELLQKVQ